MNDKLICFGIEIRHLLLPFLYACFQLALR